MLTKAIPPRTEKALEKLTASSGKVLSADGFYLADGTAVALQLAHRVSYDLDWFSPKNFEPQQLISDFNRNGIVLTDIETSIGTLQGRLAGCFVSFMAYQYPLLEKFVDLKLSSHFQCASLLDIALMKVTAIADRGVRKDFIDLYAICQELGGLDTILAKFPDKFPDANLIHYLKGLTFFEDAEDSPELEMLEKYDWTEIKTYFTNQVQNFKIS